MSFNKVVCIVTPYSTTSCIDEDTLNDHVKYARLVYSIASMLQGYEIYVPALLYSSLPDKWVKNPLITKDALYKHHKEDTKNEDYGWRSSGGLEAKADEVWYTMDLPFTPRFHPKNKYVSIVNIHKLTEDEEKVEFIDRITKGKSYQPFTIDLVDTVLASQNKEVKFRTLEHNT